MVKYPAAGQGQTRNRLRRCARLEDHCSTRLREIAVTDPKPPEQTPAPSAPSKPYISPKLREKLEGGGGDDGDEWSPKSGPPVGPIIIGLLAIGAIVTGVIWLRASSEQAKQREAMQARADSIAAIARAESLAVAAQADSALRADTTAARPGTKAPVASGGASSSGGSSGSSGSSASATPSPPPPPATDGFGVEIGQFMSEDRANGERDRLAGVTGLPGLVTPRDDGGTTVYRVILGKFSSRAAAERRAQALMDSSLVREASVVARPRSGT